MTHPRTLHSSKLHTKPHGVTSQNTTLFKPTYQTIWHHFPEHYTLQNYIPNHMVSQPRTLQSSNLHTKPHGVTSQNTIIFITIYQAMWCHIPEHHNLHNNIPSDVMWHSRTPSSSKKCIKPCGLTPQNTITFIPQGVHQISNITLNTSVPLHILTCHIKEGYINPSSL